MLRRLDPPRPAAAVVNLAATATWVHHPLLLTGENEHEKMISHNLQHCLWRDLVTLHSSSFLEAVVMGMILSCYARVSGCGVLGQGAISILQHRTKKTRDVGCATITTSTSTSVRYSCCETWNCHHHVSAQHQTTRKQELICRAILF